MRALGAMAGVRVVERDDLSQQLSTVHGIHPLIRLHAQPVAINVIPRESVFHGAVGDPQSLQIPPHGFMAEGLSEFTGDEVAGCLEMHRLADLVTV
jgi:hypothetical protein